MRTLYVYVRVWESTCVCIHAYVSACPCVCMCVLWEEGIIQGIPVNLSLCGLLSFSIFQQPAVMILCCTWVGTTDFILACSPYQGEMQGSSKVTKCWGSPCVRQGPHTTVMTISVWLVSVCYYILLTYLQPEEGRQAYLSRRGLHGASLY